MGYKVNKHLCVVALARTTTVVALAQRLQGGKSLDSGLERLYITLNSLKYSIRIASEFSQSRLFLRPLQNYITLQREVWLDAYTFRNASPRILITPQSEKKHEKWYNSFNGILSPIYIIQSKILIITNKKQS